MYVTRDYFVVKIKGHMAWASRGENTYYPTQVYVFQRVEDDEEQGYFHCDELFSFPIKGEVNPKWLFRNSVRGKDA